MKLFNPPAGGQYSIFLFFVLCSLFFIVIPVLAVTVIPLLNPLGTEKIPQLFGRFIKGFLGITGTIALVMFIYGGITWLTSAGSPDKIKKGKDVFLWSVVGLIIIFSSYLMVDFVIKGLTAGSTAENCPVQAEKTKASCLIGCETGDQNNKGACTTNCETTNQAYLAACKK